MAAECARTDVREEHRTWHAQRRVRMREQPHRLIFLDETSTPRRPNPASAAARANAYMHAPPSGTGRRTPSWPGCTVISEDSWIIDGSITRSAFDIYIETRLAPMLRNGDGVILENLAVDKSEKAARCLRQRGAWSLFLAQ